MPRRTRRALSRARADGWSAAVLIGVTIGLALAAMAVSGLVAMAVYVATTDPEQFQDAEDCVCCR